MTAKKNAGDSPESKTEAKAEVKAEAKTEAKADAKTEAKTETKAEVKTAPKGDAKPRPTAEAPGGVPASPKGDRIRKLLPVVGILLAALGVGGSVGIVVIGPQLQTARSAHRAQPPDQKEDKQAEGEHEGGRKEGGHQTVGPVLKIDNIIVNPAGCQGSRFLMAGIAIEVPDEEACEALRVSEVRLRDEVISILTNRTLEQLTRPDARDSIKEDVGRAASKMAGKPKWIHVYLPQFVLQ